MRSPRLSLPSCGLIFCLLLPVAQALAAPPRAELLPGDDTHDWLLAIEADGDRPDDALAIAPLLRQFAVGRVTISRIITRGGSLTRWQIPLQRVAADADSVPALTLGQDQTPVLRLPRRDDDAPAADATDPAKPQAIGLQTRLLHQGPLYPGQPFLYQLTISLPANLEAPALTEPSGDGFVIRRLGNDNWQAPASPGFPGQLTRTWLVQARESGRYSLTAPRLLGHPPQADGGDAPLSIRAAPLHVEVSPAPLQPVASRLTLRQQWSPAGLGASEPRIRTLTLVMEGGDAGRVRLPPLHDLPAGLQARPDGEQQREYFTAEGVLRVERQWRQALTAEDAGEYALPALDLPWFNTGSGLIEHARLPAMTLRFEADTPTIPTRQNPGSESLIWLLPALLLRALWRGWPRWCAFYRLQLALDRGEPDPARMALLAWARLRWGAPQQHLGALPCHDAAVTGALLDKLDRACFAPSAADEQTHWRRLTTALCPWETRVIAQTLRALAGLRH